MSNLQNEELENQSQYDRILKKIYDNGQRMRLFDEYEIEFFKDLQSLSLKFLDVISKTDSAVREEFELYFPDLAKDPKYKAATIKDPADMMSFLNRSPEYANDKRVQRVVIKDKDRISQFIVPFYKKRFYLGELALLTGSFGSWDSIEDYLDAVEDYEDQVDDIGKTFPRLSDFKAIHKSNRDFFFSRDLGVLKNNFGTTKDLEKIIMDIGSMHNGIVDTRNWEWRNKVLNYFNNRPNLMFKIDPERIDRFEP